MGSSVVAGRFPIIAHFACHESHDQRDPQEEKEDPEADQDLFGRKHGFARTEVQT